MNKQDTSGFRLENSYRNLPNTFHTDVNPTPGRAPKLIVYNEALANELGIDKDFIKSDEGIAVFGGNTIPAGAMPIAQAYAGHQFGNFTRLGDGRAVLLGEQMTPENKRFDIQLKGAGKTPYSRGGDGRAGLGPMLREYIMSESLSALGIPTSRSLAVVTTGEPVIRETVLEGAIVTRIASSHLRVGTFEYAAYFSSKEELKALADYAIWRHDPELKNADNPYLGLLNSVINRQAKLIAAWQQVGFIHGVMNTDNMTISGETIDYGPCAFMDTYDPNTVFSSIDRQGRYGYDNQPYIGGWNVTRLAESLLPLLHEDEQEAITLAQDALSHYERIYEQHYFAGMRAKLGLYNEEADDQALIKKLLHIMKAHKVDYTNTFLDLTTMSFDEHFYSEKAFTHWREQWEKRLTRQEASEVDARELMRRTNPAVIARNYFVEAALAAAVEHHDFSVMEQFLKALKNPFAHHPNQLQYRTVEKSDKPYQTYCGT